MPSNILTYPIFQAFDRDGNPLSGGRVSTYLSGTDTETPTYSDSNLTVEKTNPIILDSLGKAHLYFDVCLKVVIADEDGVIHDVVDDVCPHALLDSPAFTGTPTAPTPPVGDVSTRLATTEFVQSRVEVFGVTLSALSDAISDLNGRVTDLTSIYGDVADAASSAAAAAGSASEAGDFARIAQDSAEEVVQGVIDTGAARDAAVNASISAIAAKVATEFAVLGVVESEQAALNAAIEAETSASRAAYSEEISALSETSAVNAAGIAATHAATSREERLEAETAADYAGASASAAATHRDNAEILASASGSFATSSFESAAEAQTAAADGASHATSAAVSAGKAESASDEAGSYASSALNDSVTASTAANNAQLSSDSAATSAFTATSSSTDAETFSTAASNSSLRASADAEEAKGHADAANTYSSVATVKASQAGVEAASANQAKLSAETNAASAAISAGQAATVTERFDGYVEALTVDYTTIESRLDTGDYATVKTQSQAAVDNLGRMSASYTLEVDAGGKIAGMQLVSNGESSEISFWADAFKIYNPGYGDQAVFEVSNGKVGFSGDVSVGGDLIVDGTITGKAIADGTVTSDKLATGAAGVSGYFLVEANANGVLVNVIHSDPAYDAPSGTFTAPADGLYLFHFQANARRDDTNDKVTLFLPGRNYFSMAYSGHNGVSPVVLHVVTPLLAGEQATLVVDDFMDYTNEFNIKRGSWFFGYKLA